MLQFLAAWTGVKPANVTSWRVSVTGDLTTAFDFGRPDFSIPKNIPTLDQTWALTQLTSGSTKPPAQGAQKMPAQEPGTRPHRPTNYQLHADVTVNRRTSQVTAALTNTGKAGASFAVYPDNYLTFGGAPFTVLPSASRSYVWDAKLTAGKYAFSVYGPDGFLTSFAGQVVPADQDNGPVPVVTATLRSGPGGTVVELTLANEGKEAIIYTLTPNDYQGRTQTVTVKADSSSSLMADRPLRLLRRCDNRQRFRRLPPPLRRPHRLNGDVRAWGDAAASGDVLVEPVEHALLGELARHRLAVVARAFLLREARERRAGHAADRRSSRDGGACFSVGQPAAGRSARGPALVRPAGPCRSHHAHHGPFGVTP